MKFLEIQNDLFKDLNVDDCYCHCIASDGNYGAGIAPVFIDDVFQQTLEITRILASQKEVWQSQKGYAILLSSVKGLTAHLITKEFTWGKPTYETLRNSLLDLKKQLLKCNFTGKIKMPKIGCGLDGLQWQKVKEIIKNVFHDTNFDIEIYYL